MIHYKIAGKTFFLISSIGKVASELPVDSTTLKIASYLTEAKRLGTISLFELALKDFKTIQQSVRDLFSYFSSPKKNTKEEVNTTLQTSEKTLSANKNKPSSLTQTSDLKTYLKTARAFADLPYRIAQITQLFCPEIKPTAFGHQLNQIKLVSLCTVSCLRALENILSTPSNTKKTQQSTHVKYVNIIGYGCAVLGTLHHLELVEETKPFDSWFKMISIGTGGYRAWHKESSHFNLLYRTLDVWAGLHSLKFVNRTKPMGNWMRLIQNGIGVYMAWHPSTNKVPLRG